MTPNQEKKSQNNIDAAEEKNKSTGHESIRYQSSTKRIAKNTLMLYFRQILIMLVSLYTVRVVLNTLGAEDYGIYNVVAGVVTMFSFLSGAMATASQRYFAFEMGKGNEDGLQKIFSVTMTIYVLLVLIIVLLAETVGLWFVNTKLVIPTERMVAARWIYQFATLSFMVTLLTTPYMASIIAHENMNVYAYVSIVEAALKLGIVFVLQALPYDKLIVYGGLLLIVACINTGLYRGYCKKHYLECRFRLVWDKILFKEMVSYSGWNLFGSIASMVRNQGMTILLNIFFGPLVSAARGVAVQVNAAVLSFAQNFSTALRPQIIKSYAAGEKEVMLRMLMYGTKIVFFLMLLICMPLFFEVPYIMELWLKNVPIYTITFVRLVIIDVLIDSISYPLMAVVQATGKIKLYQMIVGGSLILNLPVSYIILRLGASPESVFVVAILLSVVALLLRILVAQKLISFNLMIPFTRLLLLFGLVTIASILLPISIIHWFNTSFFKCIVFIFISIVWIGVILLSLGLNMNEKSEIFKKIFRRKI